MYLLTNRGVYLEKPFGRHLCRTETGQLIRDANQLTGFYIVRVFIQRYFRTVIVVC